MQSAKNFVARIRWKSVIALLVFVVLFIVLAKSIPQTTSNSSHLSLDVKVDPKKTSPGQETTVIIEVENRDSHVSRMVSVEVKTFDLNLKFPETLQTSQVLSNFNIGPREKRVFRITLDSTTNIVDGKYTIQAKALTGSFNPVIEQASLEITST